MSAQHVCSGEVTSLHSRDRRVSFASVPASYVERQSVALEKCLSLASLERADLQRAAFQKHNSQIWLNKLPVELLSRIFECLEVEGARDPFYGVQRSPAAVLINVCKLWQDVALSTPFLWRRISYRCVLPFCNVSDDWNLISLLINSYDHITRSYPPLWVIRLLVQRSRAVPLELEVVERSIGNRNSSANALLDMISFIRPHLSQCASLHFIVRSPAAIATLYPLNGPFPHLQSLALGPLGSESVQALSESASPQTLMLAQTGVHHSLRSFDRLSLRSFNLPTTDSLGLQY